MYGYDNNNGIAEGSHLSVRFPNDNSRIKSGASGWYRTRSADVSTSFGVCYVTTMGSYESADAYAYAGYYGIAPLIVLH